MSDLPEPRIADVDRDRASQHLQVAYSEGRISEGELEERLTAVFEARTASELSVVVVDLPTTPVTAAPPARSARTRSSLDVGSAVPFLLPAVTCTLIYLMTNPGSYFWPMWVWLGCGIPAARALFSSGDDERHDDTPEVKP